MWDLKDFIILISQNCLPQAIYIVMVDVQQISLILADKKLTHLLRAEIKGAFEVHGVFEARTSIKYFRQSKVNEYFFFEVIAPHKVIRFYVEVDYARLVQSQ